MARRGQFGRSGTSQNLTMLVYQILKSQMEDEMQSILTAYQTNMDAGMYSSQFNGQNVDGDYVISYYEQMLAGFPPGSTEYETLNSKLEAFRQRYRTDVQNLVMKSLNDGSKVDFGLLGSAFQNKGIAEVTLSDMRSWATQEIADLEADGATAQADKLKGAVFVAGFNVESDGKRAAVTRGDLSYSSYAKWIGGQLKAALDNGLTKDSKPYLDLLNLHADVLKAAKADGQVKAAEGYDKALRNAMAPVNEAALAIINAYNGPYKEEIASAWSSVSTTSMSPAYDVLKILAANPDTKAYYADLMERVGQGNLDELFADLVVESQDKVDDILKDGFGNTDPKNAAAFLVDGSRLHGESMGFLKNSGIELTSGAARSGMAELRRNLEASGMSFAPSEDNELIGRGGHPDAVLSALAGLSDLATTSSGNSFMWLQDAAKGQIDIAYLANTDFVNADTNKDFKVDANEWRAVFDSGDYSQLAIDAQFAIIAQNAAQEDIPNSQVQAASVIHSVAESYWNKSNLAAGSIMVVDEKGHTIVTERGDKQVGEEELRPHIVNVNGKTSIVYVKPITIKQDNGGNQYAPLDPSMTNDMKVTVYRIPGNFTNVPGQQFDLTVTINGLTRDRGGNMVQQSINLTGDEFQAVMRSRFGAEFDFTSLNDKDSPNPFLSFTGNLVGGKEFWNNFLNPNDPVNYIKNIPLVSGETNGPKAVPDWNETRIVQTGFTNSSAEVGQWLAAGLKNPSLIAEAQELAKRRGKEMDTKDILDSLLNNNGVVSNISYATVYGLTEQSPIWQNALLNQFANVKPATQTPVNLPNTSVYPNFQPSTYHGPGGTPFPTDKNPNWKWQPQGKAPATPGVGMAKPPEAKPAATAAPSITNNSFASSVSPFLRDSFRNRPGMVDTKPLSVGASTYKPPASKATTPTIATGKTPAVSPYIRGTS